MAQTMYAHVNKLIKKLFKYKLQMTNGLNGPV
jgi:hypothetical protein